MLNESDRDKVRYVTAALANIDVLELHNYVGMTDVNLIVRAYYEMSIEPKECNEYLKHRVEKAKVQNG